MKLTGIICGVLAMADAAAWALTRSAARVCADAAVLPLDRCSPVLRDLHEVLGPAAVVSATLAIVLLLVRRRESSPLPPCPLCGYRGGAHHCSGQPLRPR